jgi:hypothetical protein
VDVKGEMDSKDIESKDRVEEEYSSGIDSRDRVKEMELRYVFACVMTSSLVLRSSLVPRSSLVQ